MNINEKLKKASLEAEKRALTQIPDNEHIDWIPSKGFDIQSERSKRTRPWRRVVAVSAAAIFVISLACALPLMRSEQSPDDEANKVLTQNNFYNNTVSDIEIIAQPEYIPEGFVINSCTVWADGSLQIEYINGENKIVFQSYPASEVDISAFDEIIKDIEINGNAGFAANNFQGAYNNNVAWNDGNYSYIITNSRGVDLEELVKVALSVNFEK